MFYGLKSALDFDLCTEMQHAKKEDKMGTTGPK